MRILNSVVDTHNQDRKDCENPNSLVLNATVDVFLLYLTESRMIL